MAVLVGGAVHAKQSFAQIYRAAVTDLRAAFAGSAFPAPAPRDKVAGVALGAV